MGLILLIMFNTIKSRDDDTRVLLRALRWTSGGVMLLGLILMIVASIVTVQPGTVGIQILFGSAGNEPLPEGLHVINPFAKVQTMSVRTVTYTMASAHGEGNVKGDDSLAVLSRDGMTMQMDLTVAHRLDARQAAYVYRCYGTGYEANIIRPQIQEVARVAAKQFTAQEAYGVKRDALALDVVKLLRQSIKNLTKSGCAALNGQEGVVIEQVMLRNISLPAKVKSAIEDKLEAEQKAQKMVFVLERERQEAERKKVEATGIQQFQEIVRKGIDERLLRWKGIEATLQLASSVNAKVVIIGGGRDGLPMILNQDSTVSPVLNQK
jgi:regulator of protease activity HflC (stomatin/prohibitin superfamily)